MAPESVDMKAQAVSENTVGLCKNFLTSYYSEGDMEAEDELAVLHPELNTVWCQSQLGDIISSVCHQPIDEGTYQYDNVCYGQCAVYICV